MKDWYKITLENVPPGSGWRPISWEEGDADSAYFRMLAVIKEGGDVDTPPSSVRIEGGGNVQIYTWKDAFAHAYCYG